MGANKSMSRAQLDDPNTSAPTRRAFVHLAILFALTSLATVLAFSPQWFPSRLALALGILLVLILPGYLLDLILSRPLGFPDTPRVLSARELSLTRVPILFVYSLAVWAVPATALQLLSSNWSAFRLVFVIILWALTLAAVWRTRGSVSLIPLPRREILVELVLTVLCVVVAYAVWRGPRDADDWGYLQIIQQFLGSNPFQILAATEARYSIRYAFHVWIFLQAYLGEWLNADVVVLVREVLPVLLAPLALISFYAWCKTFFGRAPAALLTVVFQLLIFVTFANADGWGRGFFARSAQDKFLVWLIVLPVAFSFAWQFLNDGKFTAWFGYGAAVLAGLWVHPITLFLLVIALAGFALFNLISRAPFPRRRWLFLTVASLPALLSPLVIRAITLPVVFTVNTPDVEAYVRLSDERLLFQPPLYLADPTLVANPLILFSLSLLLLFAPRLRDDRRAQFLWGSTLLPLALVFNPLTALLLGEMVTPWQLWRVTWLIPAALILTQAVLQYRDLVRSPRAVRIGAALLLAAVVSIGLSNLNLARSFNNFTLDHALDPPVEDILRVLQKQLDAPANVILPRKITRFASAYTYRAVVLSNDAQKPEDTRGTQIDRFYDPAADPRFMDGFLKVWETDYAVTPNGSLQDHFLQTLPRAHFLYRNTAFTLYKIEREPAP